MESHIAHALVEETGRMCMSDYDSKSTIVRDYYVTRVSITIQDGFLKGTVLYAEFRKE